MEANVCVFNFLGMNILNESVGKGNTRHLFRWDSYLEILVDCHL